VPLPEPGAPISSTFMIGTIYLWALLCAAGAPDCDQDRQEGDPCYRSHRRTRFFAAARSVCR
jgi:hypothetical protein